MPNHNAALEAFVPPVVQERMAVCRQCEHYTATFCTKIDDYAMPYAHNIENKCPIDKWDIVVL